MGGRYDMTIEQGSTYLLPVAIKNKVDQTAFDLTDWTGRGQIRRTHHSTDIVAEFVVTVLTPKTNGQLEISLTALVTAGIPCGDSVNDASSIYYYDIELVNSVTSEVKRILEGKVFISPEVTR
jgi:hypothetical protein